MSRQDDSGGVDNGIGDRPLRDYSGYETRGSGVTLAQWKRAIRTWKGEGPKRVRKQEEEK